ncbi:TonB-dependent receptor [Novosphingobium sp. Leaf2]|uniref:TonB-dependent receptor n=1 Tax=Novosphingobium sp. Leaf2 TaxID=1735670 RepID=UPI0006F706E0|nr:TonB-dependent receptor [Novosphingobium sp. Leaf2]KQM13375.1 TonB-dependent receptor [Novosphingobium sp. Leaf2]
MHRGVLIAAAATALPLALPAPALAGENAVATRAGRAGEVAIELARQTGSSIIVADAQVANRAVPAVRGRMAPAEAVRRLARAAGGRAIAVAPGAWRIEAVPRSMATPRHVPVRTTSAPPPPQPAADPIVVIASKRDLRLGQVPGQVSILDRAALEAGGIGGTEKITQRIATVTSTHLGSGRNKLFIRGIADSSFTGPTQATVGQYLGDLRLTYNAPDPDLRLSDMARVEVLEGPQGTLYGAGSLGGIIRLVPNPPVLGESSGAIMLGAALTQGGAPGGDAAATINLPVTQSVAVRANIDATSLGGYIDKPLLGRNDVNRTRILSGRASVRARLAPDWTVDLIALGQSTYARDSQYATRDGEPPLSSDARVREGSNADYAMGQLVIAGSIGAIQIRSTTGAVRQHLAERYDASLDADSPRLFLQENRTRMIAHETRVWQPERGGFGWIVGVSYTHNATVLSRRFETGLTTAAATGVRNTIDEFTLYAEGSLRLRPGLTATVGGRVTHSQLGGAGEDVAAAVAFARAAVTADRTATTFLPAIALNAELLDSTALYMRYQEGFRPGGLAIESDFVRRFKGDHTSTWEFGVRHGRPGAGTFDVSASVSYTRWRDIQADFIDNSGLPSTANIGDGRVWSASLTGGVQLATGLRIEAGATWNQSRVDMPPGELLALVARAFPVSQLASTDLLDATLARSMQVPNIARFSGRVGLGWNHQFTDAVHLTANAWAGYVGKSRLGIGPQLGQWQGDYLDSGADLRIGTARYGVTLSMDNLTNARGNRFSLGTPFGTAREQVTPLRPRTVRLGLDARF